MEVQFHQVTGFMTGGELLNIENRYPGLPTNIPTNSQLTLEISMAAHAEKAVTGLRTNWTFKEKDSDEEWLEVSQFPTNIHLDLIHHKK